MVGDIEIVCIPKITNGGLFGDDIERDHNFCKVVDAWEQVKGKSTGKYAQRILPSGIKLDIFITDDTCWGLILAIRTGSADFSHNVLANRWSRLGYKSIEGVLHRHEKQFVIKEEKDLFDLLGLDWVEPEDRK